MEASRERMEYIKKRNRPPNWFELIVFLAYISGLVWFYVYLFSA
jgi:hypothetical protein